MLRTTNTAETWEHVFRAFEQVNFSAFDYDSIKQSIIEYMRIYFPESFNDLNEESEFIQIIESFAYVAEQLAYRIDTVAHENFITTAQRKQSILKLIKLVSYKPTRNIASRGLVKITSISTTEDIYDSRGINLSQIPIVWNDGNNRNWKDQFILVMNRVSTTRFGQPQKRVEVGDVLFDKYCFKNSTLSFQNGVFQYSVNTGNESFPMELTPIEIGENGPFEREPDPMAQFSFVFANDGVGDGSDYTGFMIYTKQGTLLSVDYEIKQKLPSRVIDLNAVNVNETDVWVQELNSDGTIKQRWTCVDSLKEQNLYFNNVKDRTKYEIETREGDQISLVFGDGDFSEAPFGNFRFWLRQSANQSLVIQKNKIVNQTMSFKYTGVNGNTEICTITFGLVSTIQNAAPSESIEHIRATAPATFYTQNRMVNGRDYNTLPLSDPSIIKARTVNRTFAGQPKHVDWNDASGMYENVKIFGDDLTLGYTTSIETISTDVAGQAVIDSILEPLLQERGIINMINHASASDPVMLGVISQPRKFFIEDNRPNKYFFGGQKISVSKSFQTDGTLKEKTCIQGLVDRHWYGEPIEYVQGSNGEVLARIADPLTNPKDDGKIYMSNVPRTIDGVNKYPPGDKGSDLQRIAPQPFFALRFNRYFDGIGDGSITVYNRPYGSPTSGVKEVWTIELTVDGKTFTVRSNIRGTFPTGSVDSPYYIKPDGATESTHFFTISSGTTSFEQGDAYILDVDYSGIPSVRTGTGFNTSGVINLMGWFEVIESDMLESYYSGGFIGDGDEYLFNTERVSTNVVGGTPIQSVSQNKKHSWLLFVKKNYQQNTDTVIGYEINHRVLKLCAESKTTKFWFNEVDKILDLETYKPVFDKIRILRSNLGVDGVPLSKNEIYDVVGPVKDSYGIVDVTKLEVVPSNMQQRDATGLLNPDNMLQFENFSRGSYEYFLISEPKVALTGVQRTNAINATWPVGSISDASLTYFRLQVAGDSGLDFMWQHYSPFTNVIDPSPTNIIDMYVITKGYYYNTVQFLLGLNTTAPDIPSSLELRNSYTDIIDKKMMSDTVVVHSGKFKLLFGNLAEPQLRAKFKVIRNPTGSLSNERIKEEILAVINKYFEIENWEFGQTFHATELISLIHQRLPADILSVVIVPVFSSNSFGDLFTVTCGHDEILMSCAKISDIDMVDGFSNLILRK